MMDRIKPWRVLCVVLVLTLAPAAMGDDWKFDWNIRTDRDGKPAGHYETTPFPITETTERTTITSDEGAKTYELGEKFYVDGARPDDTGDGRTLATAKKTIGAAIKAAGAGPTPAEGLRPAGGNRTILVRGAHDGFDGTYGEVELLMHSGADDTHRFMITGYGQERPVINGARKGSHTIRTTSANNGTHYVTIQRLKIQDNYGCAVRTNSKDSHLSVIDVWMFNNDKIDPGQGKPLADGNLYFLGSDYCTIRHCTSEHTFGHAYKVGDGADFPVVEWSIAKEHGYWKGFPLDSYYGAHPSGFDFPDVGQGVTLRYSIGYSGRFCAVQLRSRGLGGHVIKFNEIYDSTHFDESTGTDPMRRHSCEPAQVLLITAGSTELHNNVVRDASDHDARGVYLVACDDGTINIHNNILYGNHIGIAVNNCKAAVGIYNNSIYGDDDRALVQYAVDDINRDVRGRVIDVAVASRFRMANNVLFQAGAGACVQIQGTVRHDHNRYYFPKGSRGCEPGEGESDGDPGWPAAPTGAWRPDACRPKASLPGVNLSPLFTVDFDGLPRSTWDVGAREHHNE